MPRSVTYWTRNMPGMRFLSMYFSGGDANGTL
jgi:hypothetical protein